MSIISDAEWAVYAADLSAFYSQSGAQNVVWKRTIKRFSGFGEDNTTHTNLTIKALVSYNHFRVWPINKSSEVGANDKEYCHLLLNNDYLTSLGSPAGWAVLNSDGYINIDPMMDRFIVNGISHRLAGDTPAAQAKSNPLYTILILERDIVETSDIQR